MTALVRAAALANFAEVCRQLGLNAHQMLREAGIDARALAEPEMRLPGAQVAAVLETAAERSGCPTFGLRMAEQRRLADFGVVSLLIAHQRTLRDALETTMRYRHLLNESLAMHLEDSGDLAILREELLIERSQPARQAYELAIGVIFRLFRALLGPRWRPYSVNFSHAAPADTNVHRRVFGVEVQFRSEFNGIVCPRADLDRPNPEAEPAMAEYARQFLDTLPGRGPASAVRDVRQAAWLLLPMGRASIAHVAQGLGLNVRTLQRRLSAEGAEFSDLLNGVRRDLAVRYLANPAWSMTQIARMLGYGQLSSFTRWFIAEFGVPPTAWRAKR
ncbi:MAG TPA: AraC family transcriptional regulator [Caulobacteraceae bacterium]|nr:AraC family transcriptional regulator [Caulobacteraceae bacterium]